VIVPKAEFDEAVKKVRQIMEKMSSTSKHITVADVAEAIEAVTNVTGRFRGRPLIVSEVRREILKRAGATPIL